MCVCGGVASSFTHQFVVLQLLGVDAVGVPDASVQLANPNTLGTEAVQVAHRVQAHVAEALQEEGGGRNVALAFPTRAATKPMGGSILLIGRY